MFSWAAFGMTFLVLYGLLMVVKLIILALGVMWIWGKDSARCVRASLCQCPNPARSLS